MSDALKKEYQLIIVGGGPAGLTAGLYAARGRIDTLLVERTMWGGQAINAEHIENFPGFPKGISGVDLGMLIYEQAEQYGLKTSMTEVAGLEVTGDRKTVKTSEGDFYARAVILATGAEHGKLDVPGESRLLGKGVSYCATCDGSFFANEVVAVVGGGNTAVNDALVLARFASKVILIHRRNELRATKVLQERLFADPKIEFVWDTVVEDVEGGERVERVRVRNVKTGVVSGLSVGGVFVAVGTMPNTGFLRGLLDLDQQGNISTNELMETKIPGVFTAGDVRRYSYKQCITAAGDGATAAMSAERYLIERRK